MKTFYRQLVYNLTEKAQNDRGSLIQHCRSMNKQRNYTDGNWPSSNLPRYKSWDFPDFCKENHDFCFSEIHEKASEVHLIVDYLCIPAWTGIMVCIYKE